MSNPKTRRNILVVGFGGFAIFSAFMLWISTLPVHLTALSLLIVFPFVALITVNGARRAANVGDGTWSPKSEKDSSDQLK